MLNIISNLLRRIADRIDEGSISSNHEETMQVVEAIQGFVDKEQRLSKYEACRYLNISRATFDNYVRAGFDERRGGLYRGSYREGFEEKIEKLKEKYR